MTTIHHSHDNSAIVIQNARLVHTAGDTPQTDISTSTVYIQAGVVAGINQMPAHFAEDARIIDAQGHCVSFALADLAVRFTEKGGNHNDVMATTLAAAAAGGVAHVACQPDANPILDEPRLIAQIIRQAKEMSPVHLYPIGALTQGLKGEQLAEMATLMAQGCVALSQADNPVRNTQVLQRALAYAASFNVPVWLRVSDPDLSGGFAASGAYASRLGLSGVPAAAETIALFTVLELLRGLGSNAPSVHFTRLSTARAVQMVREAKAEGLAISCDVNMHHLHLVDTDMGYFNAQFVFDPPLRSSNDRDALRLGVLDGTIDAIVSDHTAVNSDAKYMPVGQTIAGAIGVQWLLSHAVHLAHALGVDCAVTLSACVARAYAILGLPTPVWQVGTAANIVVFDTAAHFHITPEQVVGTHLNTPWLGYELAGQVRDVVIAP